MRYMTSPLDITTDELLVYQQLYLRADFETWVVKYTDRQISDSLAKYGIGRAKVKSILDKFIDMGLFVKIQNGVRGNGSKPAIGRLVKVYDLSTQCQPNTNPIPTNKTIENTNVEEVDQPNENPIETLCNPLIKEQRTKNNIYTSEKASKNKNTVKKNKHKYGEYNHVLLTDKDKEELVQKLGEYKFDLCIKKLDEYIEETGKKYKNHNLTIRRWVIEAVKKDLNQSKVHDLTKEKPKLDEYGYEII